MEAAAPTSASPTSGDKAAMEEDEDVPSSCSSLSTEVKDAILKNMERQRKRKNKKKNEGQRGGMRPSSPSEREGEEEPEGTGGLGAHTRIVMQHIVDRTKRPVDTRAVSSVPSSASLERRSSHALPSVGEDGEEGLDSGEEEETKATTETEDTAAAVPSKQLREENPLKRGRGRRRRRGPRGLGGVGGGVGVGTDGMRTAGGPGGAEGAVSRITFRPKFIRTVHAISLLAQVETPHFFPSFIS